MRRGVLGGRGWLVGAAAVLALAGGRAGAADAQVEVTGFEFRPAVLTVHAGTSVTWTNRDEEPHTVTAAGGEFKSGGLERGDTFATTFDRPGTFEYRCALHPQMKGKVVVVK
jgi:plastocyanin